MWILIIILTLILLLIVIFSSDKDQQTTFQKNIEVPLPSVADPKKVIRFVANEEKDIIKQVYDQLMERGEIMPTVIQEAFENKIIKGYIFKEDYFRRISLENYQKEVENLTEYARAYEFELAGVHIPYRRKLINEMVIYDRVFLKKEPSNKYDPDAIKVMQSEDRKIGYVPADQTIDIEPVISGEYKAFIQSINEFDGYLQVEIIIYY